MGTRGAYGLRKGGVDKVSYNHYDSYPTELGKDILHFIIEHPDADLTAVFDFVEMVKESDKPTKAQEKISLKSLNKKAEHNGVGEKGSWYSLIREAQGDLSCHLPPHSLPYMIDNHGFLIDSLFCEWAYIINLDTLTLEVYKGVNDKPGGKGRYAELFNDRDPEEKRYYGVKLIREIPLAEVRTRNPEVLAKDLENYQEGGHGEDEN